MILINLLLAVDVLVSLLLILIVLMQRPKNEGLGAAFAGGITQEFLGTNTTNVLATITRWLGGIFFAVSLLLSFLYSRQIGGTSELQKRLGSLPVPKVAATPAPAIPPAVPSPALSGEGKEAPAPVPATGTAPVPSPATAPANPPAAGTAPAPAPGIVPGPASATPPVETPAPVKPAEPAQAPTTPPAPANAAPPVNPPVEATPTSAAPANPSPIAPANAEPSGTQSPAPAPPAELAPQPAK